MLASLSSALFFQHVYAMQGAVFLGSGSANIWLFNTIGSCSLTISTYFCEVTTQIFSFGQISLNLSVVSWMRDFTTSITSVVRMNISYNKSLVRHLISQLLTVTLPHSLYLLPDFFVCHNRCLLISSSPEEMPGTEQWLPKCFTRIIPHKTEIMECLVEIALRIDVLAIMRK